MLLRRSGMICVLMLAILMLTCRSQADPITATMRAEDARLQTPITLSAPRIYLAELLERLSQQSGVKLTMNPREDESGILVTAYLDKIPLADVLDAVWSLVSFQHAEYAVGRAEENGTYRYTLATTPRSKELPELLRRMIWDAYEQEATLLMTASKMSPQERKKLGQRNPLLRDSVLDERTMAGVSAIAENLSPAQQQALFGGESSIHLPLDQLSPQAQAFVREQAKNFSKTVSRIGSDGLAHVETITEPTGLELNTRLFAHRLYPTLFVGYGSGSATTYIGRMQMEEDMRARIAALWLLPGDKTNDALETKRLPASRVADPNYLAAPDAAEGYTRPRTQADYQAYDRMSKRRLETRLEQFAHAAPVSLLARLPTPEETGDAFGSPYGQKVGSYLQHAAQNNPYVMYKWRGGMLLLCAGDWFEHLDSAAYTYVQTLRATVRANSGFLSPAACATAAEALNGAQLRSLGDEFPALNNVAVLQPLFRLANSHREMLTETGMAVAEEGPNRTEFLTAMKTMGNIGLDPKQQFLNVASVRLVEERTGASYTPSLHGIGFQLRDAEGKVTASFGLMQNKLELARDTPLPAHGISK